MHDPGSTTVDPCFPNVGNIGTLTSKSDNLTNGAEAKKTVKIGTFGRFKSWLQTRAINASESFDAAADSVRLASPDALLFGSLSRKSPQELHNATPVSPAKLLGLKRPPIPFTWSHLGNKQPSTDSQVEGQRVPGSRATVVKDSFPIIDTGFPDHLLSDPVPPWQRKAQPGSIRPGSKMFLKGSVEILEDLEPERTDKMLEPVAVTKPGSDQRSREIWTRTSGTNGSARNQSKAGTCNARLRDLMRYYRY